METGHRCTRSVFQGGREDMVCVCESPLVPSACCPALDRYLLVDPSVRSWPRGSQLLALLISKRSINQSIYFLQSAVPLCSSEGSRRQPRGTPPQADRQIQTSTHTHTCRHARAPPRTHTDVYARMHTPGTQTHACPYAHTQGV